MSNKLSSKGLYEPPTYILKDGSHFSSFHEALLASDSKLSIDSGALTSYFSFGYVTGDRTIFNEIKRKPWLSKLSDRGEIVLESIPEHNFFGGDYNTIARKFHNLLLEEARDAIRGYENVYVLLSGGLDSRIVAGLVSKLYERGEIKNKPIGVTWGLENSRDVQYGKKMAHILNLEWKYIPMNYKTVLHNIELTGKYLGLIHSPELLHNMNWLNGNTDSNSIVLAGSFGDSIGRGEFGGMHLLDIHLPKISDNFGLLSNVVYEEGKQQAAMDIRMLKERSKSNFDYVHNEHFMQGYRMRNGLCHALTIMNKESNVYQMFTSPPVYEYIWGIHPSFRGDEIYAHLLNDFYPELARIPWARTNKALVGKTEGASNDLLKDYHQYTKWSRDDLREELESMIEIDWFESTGLFRRNGLINLRNIVRKSQARVGRTNEFWLWLAGFKALNDYVTELGKTIVFPDQKFLEDTGNISNKDSLKKIVLKYVSKSEVLTRMGKNLRKEKRIKELKNKKQKMLSEYPPKKLNF